MRAWAFAVCANEFGIFKYFVSFIFYKPRKPQDKHRKPLDTPRMTQDKPRKPTEKARKLLDKPRKPDVSLLSKY